MTICVCFKFKPWDNFANPSSTHSLNNWDFLSAQLIGCLNCFGVSSFNLQPYQLAKYFVCNTLYAILTQKNFYTVFCFFHLFTARRSQNIFSILIQIVLSYDLDLVVILILKINACKVYKHISKFETQNLIFEHRISGLRTTPIFGLKILHIRFSCLTT